MLLSIFAAPQSDFWHDPLLLALAGIVATLLAGIIGAIATEWISSRNERSKKEITYQIVADAPIVTIHEKAKDKVKILLNGSQVEDARLVILTLWNSGKVAVRTEDYLGPFQFSFEGRTVIDADVLETKPTYLIDQISVTHGGENVEVAKFPLNPKEEIMSIRVLLTGTQGKISSRGRIADGRIIEFDPVRALENQAKRYWKIILVTTALMLLFAGVAGLLQQFLVNNMISSVLVWMVLPLLFVFFFYLIKVRSLYSEQFYAQLRAAMKDEQKEA